MKMNLSVDPRFVNNTPHNLPPNLVRYTSVLPEEKIREIATRGLNLIQEPSFQALLSPDGPQFQDILSIPKEQFAELMIQVDMIFKFMIDAGIERRRMETAQLTDEQREKISKEIKDKKAKKAKANKNATVAAQSEEWKKLARLCKTLGIEGDLSRFNAAQLKEKIQQHAAGGR